MSIYPGTLCTMSANKFYVYRGWSIKFATGVNTKKAMAKKVYE